MRTKANHWIWQWMFACWEERASADEKINYSWQQLTRQERSWKGGSQCGDSHSLPWSSQLFPLQKHTFFPIILFLQTKLFSLVLPPLKPSWNTLDCIHVFLPFKNVYYEVSHTEVIFKCFFWCPQLGFKVPWRRTLSYSFLSLFQTFTGTCRHLTNT